ncbi:arginine N-succinyltransferase [Vibrio mangrovi]|uniref:Arginine N-succinyltransferase n=1 Tax=Vibrio mangrovi TaxID=474394 RepID=A0A1Y6J1I8_9VIBR|nr:arginine N-succinyltransferase [Vibrio mangrovi]MDW6005218.1 arginine N-succinyltransferase [Vibrio mangrovi]SMS02572.1 Arginine N-succinyltransferase subunit alpha [Vibrio mangrovi]
MIIFRPAQLSDIQQIERLAHESGPMVYTLPAQRSHLIKKVERSIDSFRQDVFSPGEESYFFVLEETMTGQILGTGAINALAGYQEPFYALRNDILIHSSRELKVHSRIHALTLNHDLSDHSQLCSFYVIPALKNSLYPALITLGRLMFMSIHPERFTNDWLAVIPGVADKNGRAPFWEHVGRKFFRMDYNQVEYYNGTRDKTFIAELMPHHPLYVPLIDEEAQAVMGQVHPDAELQCGLLSEQGFEPDKYVEIFDAGPILTANRNTLDIWQNHRLCRVKLVERLPQAQKYLIGVSTETDFRAVMAEAWLEGSTLLLEDEALLALGIANSGSIESGRQVWCFPVNDSYFSFSDYISVQ